jgi:threonyl-tRNA synthetase
MNITDTQADYAQQVTNHLRAANLRVYLDLQNEKITYKIRAHSAHKPPFMLVLGDQEKAAGTVSVRSRGNVNLGSMPLNTFMEMIKSQVDGKV